MLFFLRPIDGGPDIRAYKQLAYEYCAESAFAPYRAVPRDPSILLRLNLDGVSRFPRLVANPERHIAYGSLASSYKTHEWLPISF